MIYNFDEIILRKGTNSLKYDFAEKRGKQKDIIPMWVADMDFRVPDLVSKRLVELSEHGIFGYSDTEKQYFNAIAKWMENYHEWHIQEEWLIKMPGVVFAIAMAIKALTNEDDAILIQQPVYYPFSELVLNNNRKLISNNLICKNGQYIIDFEDFECKIIKENIKLFILCNPHNPVGRVWTKEELIRLGDICLKHHVMVLSDEIHQDFTYKDYKHEVFINLKKSYEDITITCTSPSKTFNLAGLQISNIFIPNQKIRTKIKKEMSKSGYSQLNIAGIIACEAAYTGGREWLEQLKIYLTDNLNYLRNFLVNYIPQIKLIEPEGTYLVWIDFRELGLNEYGRRELIEKKANLWLDTGTMFGDVGEGFERINIACPRSILKQALEQLLTSINDLDKGK